MPVDATDRNPCIDGAAVEPGVLGYEAQRTDLAARSDDDADVHDGSEPDRDAALEADLGGLDDARLDGVAGQVHLAADHDVVADLEKIVVADEERVHVDALADARAIETKIDGPERRPSKEASGNRSHDV